ncbi:MAG: reverse transcriptase family protein [Acidobacteriota bacterium]
MPPIRFDLLQTRAQVSSLWGVAIDDLETIDNTPDLTGRYREMRIPKRGRVNQGRYRTVFKVEWGVLHQLQKNIARDIGDTVTFPDCVQGFVRGRSIVSNARVHVGQVVIFHADIENFFDAIGAERVAGAFVSLGCEPSIAELLSKVCTLMGRLPQGASTSPILANLVSAALDLDLTRLAATQHLRYSRYGDDLTFSGEQAPTPDAIRRLLSAHGFALREDKVRTQRRGKCQYVTGLSIIDPAGPRIPRKTKRQLRLELYYAKKYGIAGHQERTGNHWYEERLWQYWRGWIDYIGSVPAERPLAKRLAAQLHALK